MASKKTRTLRDIYTDSMAGKAIDSKDAKMLAEYVEGLLTTINDGKALAYSVVSTAQFECYPEMRKKANLHVGEVMKQVSKMK